MNFETILALVLTCLLSVTGIRTVVANQTIKLFMEVNIDLLVNIKHW